MIATFYSFKGGVGRSFALLEAAAQLAERGRSVVVWDLDLEAPGLQQLPALKAIERHVERGTLDLLDQFLQSNCEYPEDAVRSAIVDFPPARDRQRGYGRLSFLFSGRVSSAREYEELFARIDWSRLFAPRDGPGPAFFHRTAAVLHDLGYEYVLIDSRTGYTDLGAICTFQLPDLVVLVFNLNEQNVEGIARVSLAVTQTRSRDGSPIPIVSVANMVPFAPAGIRRDRAALVEEARLIKLSRLESLGIRPHIIVPLRPERLVTDAIPSLDGDADEAKDWRPIAEELEARRARLDAARDQEERELRLRRPQPDDATRRRHDLAVSFEERVAQLFRLIGYSVESPYQVGDLEFDARVNLQTASVRLFALIECKASDQPVTVQQIGKFAAAVDRARTAEMLPYQGILVSQGGFTATAGDAARKFLIELRTFDQLTRGLMDLSPVLDPAIRGFEGTALERLYVAPDVVVPQMPGRTEPERRPAMVVISEWLARDDEPVLLLLGEFGVGKTSLCRRIAFELASRRRGGDEDARAPIVVSLRDASTPFSLEHLLTQHFQQLSPQAFSLPVLLHLNREGHLLVMFDGFDEMARSNDVSQPMAHLRQLLRAAEGKAKILVTCRTSASDDLLKGPAASAVANSAIGTARSLVDIKGIPDIRIAYLQDFSDAQVDEYLQKSSPLTEWQSIRKRIEQTPNLLDLVGRPVLLEMIIRLFPTLSEWNGIGEQTVAELYEIYCDRELTHTQFGMELTLDQRSELVEHLAKLIWESPDGRAHYQELVPRAIEMSGVRPFEPHVIDYALRATSFVSRDPGGYYSFSHRSFLDFFVARGVRRGLRQLNLEALRIRRLTPEIGVFLEGTSEARLIPILSGRILEAPRQPGVSENALLLLYWHTRAQAMKTGIEESTAHRHVLQRVRERFRRARPAIIDLRGADLSDVDLSGIDLSAARLESVDFYRAKLTRGCFDRANLDNARLAFADVEEASFVGAILTFALLDHTVARHVRLTRADLRGADLRFAHLVGAELSDSTSSGAKWTGAALLGAHVTPDSFDSSDEYVGTPEPRSLTLTRAGHTDSPLLACWSPDGTAILTAHYDRTLRVWDVAAERIVRTIYPGYTPSTIEWSPRGDWFATGGHRGELDLWRAASGSRHRLMGHGEPVASVAFFADGERLGSHSDTENVKVWDVKTGQVMGELGGEGVSSWAANGNQIALGYLSGTLRIWERHTGPVSRKLQIQTDAIRALAWAPRGDQLAVAGDDGVIKLISATTGDVAAEFISEIVRKSAPFISLEWASTGNRIVTHGEQGVEVWDVGTGRLHRTFERVTGSQGSATLANDGERLASVDISSGVEIVDVSAGRVLQTLRSVHAEATAVVWTRGHQIAVGSDYRVVTIWDTETGCVCQTLPDYEQEVTALSWNAHQQLLASGSMDGAIKIWDGGTGQPMHVAFRHASAVTSIAWAPHGQQLASTDTDGVTRIWDPVSGSTLRSRHRRPPCSITWTPDGDRLALSSSDGPIQIWDFRQDIASELPRLHIGTIWSIAWAPREDQLACGFADGVVELRKSDGQLLGSLHGPLDSVASIAWAPRGNRLAAASQSGTIAIWDAKTQKLLYTLSVAAGNVTDIAWRPDGERMCAASTDGWIYLWEIGDRGIRAVGRLAHFGDLGSLAVSADERVAGDAKALALLVSFSDGWATYSVEDVPARVSPQHVATRFSGKTSTNPPRSARKDSSSET